MIVDLVVICWHVKDTKKNRPIIRDKCISMSETQRCPPPLPPAAARKWVKRSRITIVNDLKKFQYRGG